MKNKLSDLNDHLFAQLERLGDENLTAEQIDREHKRGKAIVAVADKIIGNAKVQVEAAKLVVAHGQKMKGALGDDPMSRLTSLEGRPSQNLLTDKRQ